MFRRQMNGGRDNAIRDMGKGPGAPKPGIRFLQKRINRHGPAAVQSFRQQDEYRVPQCIRVGRLFSEHVDFRD